VRFIADVLNARRRSSSGSSPGLSSCGRPSFSASRERGARHPHHSDVGRTTEEMVRLVPHSLREAALALGYRAGALAQGRRAHRSHRYRDGMSRRHRARRGRNRSPAVYGAGNLNFSFSVTQRCRPCRSRSTCMRPSLREWHRLAGLRARAHGLVLMISLTARW